MRAVSILVPMPGSSTSKAKAASISLRTAPKVSALTRFDGSTVKYIDGSMEDFGARIEQEIVFAGTGRLIRLLEVSRDGDLKKTATAARAAGPRSAVRCAKRSSRGDF